jgi:hypothetical protein
MRQWRFIAIAAALAATGVFGIASSSAHGKAKVMCLSQSLNSGSFEVRPTDCVLHHKGRPYDQADSIDLKSLQWSKWGSRAVGLGTVKPSMGGPVAVKVKLSRVEHQCGRRVFTRAVFKYHNAPAIGPVKLDTCPPA